MNGQMSSVTISSGHFDGRQRQRRTGIYGKTYTCGDLGGTSYGPVTTVGGSRQDEGAAGSLARVTTRFHRRAISM